MKGWEIIEDNKFGVTGLLRLGTTARPSGALPCWSSRGYEVTHDGWILNATKKRVLWLPHRWRSGNENRTWGGRFLGLTHYQLPEVVILEFFD